MAENISPFLTRTALLLGQEAVQRLQDKTVVQAGLGGVGGSCAEALCRSGLGAMHLIDGDYVEPSNLNRQLFAAKSTLGLPKTEAARRRLEDVSDCRISVHFGRITPENVDSLLPPCDYIIDAIDSLKDKALLILRACQTRAVFFSSMGAALKMDPTKIRVAEFWKVRGCPLGAALRKKFKHMKVKPAHKFRCVYSEELLENRGPNHVCGTAANMCPKVIDGPGDPALVNHEWCSSKAQVNGSMAHITAIFGFTIAGLVLDDIYRKTLENAASDGE